jgi:polysaccharide chain length determinant protein (PEP-CTERM system associated)
MLVTDRLDPRQSESFGLEFLVALWSRRKWIALLVFTVVLAATVSIIMSLPDLYRATATVLVETQHVSEELIRSSVSAELETRLQTIREDVMSRARLGDLITRLGLYPELRAKGEAFDAIIERMRKDVDLDLNSATAAGARVPTIAFAIKYTGRNPQTVAQVANMLASLYVAENTKIREGQAARTAEFLKTQLAEVKNELDAQERRASEFNLSHIGELPQQVSANLASLERLNTQLRLNGENQVRAMDRRERLERQLTELASAPGTIAADQANASAPEQAAKLKQQLEQLRKKYTDQYPEVIRVQAELEDLERQLSEHAVAANPAAKPPGAAAPSLDPRARLVQAIADDDAELAALKNEETAFRRAIASYEQRVENVPRREEELSTLSRDSTTTKDRYDTLLKRYEEAQLASSLEQGQKVEQFRILDAAIPPREPTAPSRSRLFAIGVFLAIGLAVGSVLAVEKLDTAFHNIDDLRAFVTVPTLFSIPRILTTADARRRWRRGALTAVSVAIGLALLIAGSHYIASDNEQLVRLTAGTRG